MEWTHIQKKTCVRAIQIYFSIQKYLPYQNIQYINVLRFYVKIWFSDQMLAFCLLKTKNQSTRKTTEVPNANNSNETQQIVVVTMMVPWLTDTIINYQQKWIDIDAPIQETVFNIISTACLETVVLEEMNRVYRTENWIGKKHLRRRRRREDNELR